MDLGEYGLYTLVTRYNYTASCWTLDIVDSSGGLLLSGLMLVPNVDILSPYPEFTEMIGGLFLIESKLGEYLLPESLGATTYLLWYSPDEMVGV